jgi:outer membrane protein insertion porin family
VPREAPAQPQQPAQPAPVQPVQPAQTAPQEAPAVPGVEAPKMPELPPQAGQYVEAVEFRGARRVPQDVLKQQIATKAGDPYTEETLRRDFMSLWNTGRFDDLRLEVEPGRSGLLVRFVVTERRVIRSIDYVGVKSVTVSEILDRFKERKVGLSVESQYDPSKIQRAVIVLKEYLGERGHEYATVEPVIEQIPPSSLKLTFNVNEGPKVKVGRIETVGNQAFTNKWIVGQMKLLRPIGLQHSILFENVFAKTYDVMKLEDDETRIRLAYMDRGYFNIKVQEDAVKIVRRGGSGWRLPPIKMNLPSIQADIKLNIEEGRQYHLRNITFQGVALFRTPNALFRPVFRMGEGDVFSRDKLTKGLEEMRKLYGRFGYIDMTPDFEPDFIPNTDQADLTLTADEGKQFFIRRIDFAGNTTTRDKVIRREILLDEGDMLNMDLWDYSLLRLNQLGYFEMLKKEDAVVMNRNPNSNTVDITLKVKERGKNTIGLNGGVSGISGSFVGLNYATNNFLGLGETLSLESQIGTTMQSVSLGFTEPYLLDRPISTGVNVYLRRFKYDQAREASILAGANLIPMYEQLGTQNLLNYTQNSKGFTFSASTHLKRSFAQIGLSYGYDDSTITTQTSAALNYFTYLNYSGVSGPNSLRGIKTSQITLSYSTNSVNHPVYPTQGRSLFVSAGFAGSVLGGNVNTIRPTVDFKYFKPSPLHKGPNPHVLAFHLMASSLTGYGGRVAPPNTRTFIGGEQDVRGFNIWGITPVAFIPATTSVPLLNNDGTNRIQTVISNGRMVQAGVYSTVPTYQLITPGGDTQVVGNFEYRITVIPNVFTVEPFFDVGLNRVLLSRQLSMESSHINDLNLQFPQAGYQQRVIIAAGTQRPRTSTGLEVTVTLPIVQAPFRIYFAYNPTIVRQDLQPPIVTSLDSYPNYATYANAIRSTGVGQSIPWFEKRTTFRFTMGKTF